MQARAEHVRQQRQAREAARAAAEAARAAEAAAAEAAAQEEHARAVEAARAEKAAARAAAKREEQQWRVAGMHHVTSVMKYAGWRPWVAAVQRARGRQIVAEEHDKLTVRVRRHRQRGMLTWTTSVSAGTELACRFPF